MATFTIETKTFDDPKTGNVIPYDRFVIKGYVLGKLREVALKLEKNELAMVSMIMDSTEQKPTVETHKALDDEMYDFLSENN